jgi:hypothetical protein
LAEALDQVAKAAAQNTTNAGAAEDIAESTSLALRLVLGSGSASTSARYATEHLGEFVSVLVACYR